jgi:hypothetical protein
MALRCRPLLCPLLVLQGLAACGEDSPAPPPAADVGPAQDVQADTAPPPPPAPLLEVPVELAGVVRLEASPTRISALWVREDRDGPQALRDDSPDTRWKPAEGPVTLCLTALPLAGRALRLHQLRWEGPAGAPPASVFGLPHCDAPLAEVVPLALVESGDVLALDDRAWGALALQWEDGEEVEVSGLSLTSRDAGAPALLPTGNVVSERRHAAGLIEGFYGVPWSWDERTALVEAAAAAGLRFHVYAPKLDPLHRDRWREPWPTEFVDRFAALHARGAALGIDVYLGISPFIDFDPASDDPATLEAKLRPFVDAGVTHFMLLADDIEEVVRVTVDAALADVHGAVANDLVLSLGLEGTAEAFVFVPTVYSDERRARWAGGAAYLASLASLRDEVAIAWTGTDTFAPTMAAADFETFTAATGRAPWIWDNLWANDGGDGLFGRIYLGTIEARAADVPGASAGMGQNPLIQGALTRLLVTAFGGWLDEPSADPSVWRAAAADAEWSRLPQSVRTESDRALLVALQGAFDGTALQPAPRMASLEAAALALRTELEAGRLPPAPLRALLRELVWMAVLPSTLHHSALGSDMVDELVFPVQRLTRTAEQALWTLLAARERLAGREREAGRMEGLASEARAATEGLRFQVELSALLNLLPRLAGMPVPEGGFFRWDVLPPPTPCMVGERLVWPLGQQAAWEVAGLPGAAVEEDGSTLVWTPPHAGRWQAGLAGTQEAQPAQFTWALHDLRCVER